MKDTQSKPITAMIIEDEELLRNMIVMKFKEKGYNALSAPNGIVGLTLALEKHPDIILMDIMMPEMDGIEVLKKLRMDDWGKTVPVIMLTNVSDPRLVATSLEEQSFEYLIKTDWDIDEIMNKIDEKLHASK
jgi:DNA-binding response OmpR family regulator